MQLLERNKIIILKFYFLEQNIYYVKQFIIFLNREIIHYFVNFFKVSGRSIEESLISTLPYIFYILLDN